MRRIYSGDAVRRRGLLMFGLDAVLPGVIDGAFKVLDRVIPDPEARDKAKLALMQADGQQALAEMQTQLSAILAEAQSADPWTSRARPTFLYIIYLVILLCIVGGVIGIWFPGHVQTAATNITMLFNGIPDSLWTLFGVGYLGYTGARSFDKWRGAK